MMSSSDPKNRTDPSLQDSYGPETAPTHYQHADGPQVVSYPEYSYPQAVSNQDQYQNNEKYSNAHQQTPTASKRRKILGLPVAWFWVLVVAIVLALCVALGVGLGVGLSQSNSSTSGSNSDNAQATSSAPSPSEDAVSGSATAPVSSAEPTSDPASTESSTSSAESTESSSPSITLSAPVTSGTVGLSDNSCTSTTPRTYVSDDGQSFLQYCFTDWPNGGEAADGSGEILDVYRTITYTFEDCMDACLAYNDRLASGRTKCGAVTYNSNLTSIIAEGRQGGNCFLKDKKGVDHQGRAESACAVMVA